MEKNNRGFTLLEVLVTTAIFATIMIGILNLLDTSAKVSKLETALADTQENVRFAAYHIMRTTRMMGGAVLPFAANIGGTDTWVMGELLSNQTGTVTTAFGDVTVLPGLEPPFGEFWEQVRRLPTRQAQVIALHYLEDRPVAEIAEILGTAPGTVKAQLHSARVALADRLGATIGDSS